MGISAIWVIEPKKRHYFRYRDGQLARVTTLEMPGSTFTVAIDEIAALVD